MKAAVVKTTYGCCAAGCQHLRQRRQQGANSIELEVIPPRGWDDQPDILSGGPQLQVGQPSVRLV